MPEAFNMIERKEPAFVKFDHEGQSVEGVLVSIEQVQIADSKNLVARYTVRELETGELQSFLGGYQIDTKINLQDQGHVINVRYEGEDKSVTRNGRAMRKFKVLVSDKPYGAAAVAVGRQLEDGTYITNADIGF